MMELRRQEGTAILLITHDLAVVAETCDRVAVMYGGRVQETADAKSLFRNARHPYTRGLLKSLPRPDQAKKERLETIPGIVPSILDFPKGCKFWTRCPVKEKRCEETEPDLLPVAGGHDCRCHLAPRGEGAP
jgi:oligopeptide/dipeptide ABC transporter ATP-binding protein